MPPPVSVASRLEKWGVPTLAPVAALHHTIAVCALLVVATVVSPADAQDIRGGVRIGPTFGFLNDSAVPFTSEDPETNANPRVDFHVGAYTIVPLTDHFALQPELLYVQKGGHFSRPRSQSYAAERYQLSYMQGELLVRRDISIPGPLSLHAVAGVSIDVTLRGTLRRNLRDSEMDFEERVALLDTGQLQRWDMGVLLGAGLGYPIGTTGRLALELRYNPGFRDVFPNAERPALPGAIDALFPLPDTYAALRHDVITASLSYTVPLASLF